MADHSISDYKVIRNIAGGNFGDILEAVDLARGRHALIRPLPPDLSRRPESSQRLEAEIQRLALLVHPNIAAVFGLIQDEKRLYLATELVGAETLQDLLKRRGRIDPAAALALFVQILRAVDFAHHIGCIHGDLKPAHIMVTPSGAVKVRDFGLAAVFGRPRKTRAGYLVGTPQYLAPEQIRGEPADARSDIYSLGILFYEMLVGHVPFHSENDDELLRAQIAATPLPPSALVPDIPEKLDAFFDRALAKPRSQRFQSVAEMAAALKLRVEAARPAAWWERRSAWAYHARLRAASLMAPLVSLGSETPRCLARARAQAVAIAHRSRRATARRLAQGAAAFNPRLWINQLSLRLAGASRRFALALRSMPVPRISLSGRERLVKALAAGWSSCTAAARRPYKVAAPARTPRAERAAKRPRFPGRVRPALAVIVSAGRRFVEAARLAPSAPAWKKSALLPLALFAVALQIVFLPGDVGREPRPQKPLVPAELNEPRRPGVSATPRTSAAPVARDEAFARTFRPAEIPAEAPSRERADQPMRKVLREPTRAPADETVARAVTVEPPSPPPTRQNDRSAREPTRPEPKLPERGTQEENARVRLNVKWEN